jgi:hypothetical protein
MIDAQLIGVSLGRKNVLQGTREERIFGGRGWAREGAGGGGDGTMGLEDGGGHSSGGR